MNQGRYRVLLARPASRALSRLPPKIADAVIRFIAGPLAENPMRVTKALTFELSPFRACRVGLSYRLIVAIDEIERVVEVKRIAHRADIYRTM